MIHNLNVGHRITRLRAFLVALVAISFAACDTTDQLTSNSPADPAVPETPAADPTALTLEDTLGATDLSDPTGGVAIYDDEDDSIEEENGEFNFASPAATRTASSGMSLSNYRGGIPFGVTQMPKEMYGRFSGALSNPGPERLMSFLEAARRSGTRVMLVFAGNERYFKTRSGYFSLEMWKARVARYRRVNFASYIKDGTIIGHRMIDEPHDPRNWHGRPVTRQELDAMAKYSKSLWPTMATIVRSWPAYLKGYSYRYLDGAWAQYASRFGSITAFLNANVRDAKAARLSLTVGLNQIAGTKSGGLPGYYRGFQAFTASQLKSLGGALLSDSYPCAFLNWKYNDRYMSRSDIKSALSYLAGKARNKPFKTCG